MALLCVIGLFAAHIVYFVAHLACELLDGKESVKVCRWLIVISIFWIAMFHGIEASLHFS